MSVTSPTLKPDPLAAVVVGVDDVVADEAVVGVAAGVLELLAAGLPAPLLLLLLLPHAASPPANDAHASATRLARLNLPVTKTPFVRTDRATINGAEDNRQLFWLTVR